MFPTRARSSLAVKRAVTRWRWQLKSPPLQHATGEKDFGDGIVDLVEARILPAGKAARALNANLENLRHQPFRSSTYRLNNVSAAC